LVIAPNFSIWDTVTNTPVAIKSVAHVFGKLAHVLILTDLQTEGGSYGLMTKGVSDLAGNSINPLANSLTFEASAKPDTMPPSVSAFSIADSTVGVELAPKVYISFSDVMAKASVESAISSQDSLGENILFARRWLSDAALELAPTQPLRSKMWYRMTIDPASIKNLNGLSGHGKPRTYRFETVDAELLSSVEGGVIDRSRTDATGPVILIAENAVVKEAKPFTIKLEQPGNFTMNNLPEGQYILRAFRDRNSNGKYDVGRPMPFTPSERFTVYPDTLKLRARWPLEGVSLQLR
ncbi:MAG TPA: Ig-like domain-containing protein, partial [Bacteroidota bacterium]